MLPNLVKGLCEVYEGGDYFVSILEGIFYRLGKVDELVFSVSVFPEGRLFFGDQVVCFQVPHQSFVDHSFKSLAKATEQADWSVACFLFRVFPLFEDGDDGSFFPRCREDASCPRLVEEFKQLLFCSFPKMSDHLVADSVFPWGLLVLDSYDGIFEF